MFGKKRPDFSKWVKTHPRLGKNNSSYKDGRTLKKYYCISCNKELSKSAYQSKKRCVDCGYKNRKVWNKDIKIANLFCKHHLDLNKKNNKESNILKLTNSQHSKFHRWAYHYLVKVLGNKEVLKYKEWFFKQKGIKCEN